MATADDARTMRIALHPDSRDDVRQRGAPEAPPPESSGAAAAAQRLRGRDIAPEYRLLLASIYDAVLITDVGGFVIDFNARAMDFFLYGAEELTGLKVTQFISGADDSLLDSIHRNLQNHKYTLIEARCRRRDRSVFPAEIAVNRINLFEEGQLCFFVRDITVRKKVQQDLEDAVRRLKENDRARSLFVSNVSHELRTPLTSMIYGVNNMLHGVVGPVPYKIHDYLKMLEGDAKRLLATVNDILDVRKLENQSLTLNRVRLNLAHLVRGSVESLRIQMEQKGLALELDIGKGSWFVDCDPERFERVILNIASNAVKFTPGGGAVKVMLYDDPSRQESVLLAIQDSGVGIPRDALTRVTERYFTVGEQPSGTGLGLAISKEIVDLHGGKLKIMSPPPGKDTGTVVYIRLPLVDPPQILVISDDEQRRQALSELLASERYAVTGVTGEDAMSGIRTLSPDAILIVSGPSSTGIGELVVRTRRDPDVSRIPAMVLDSAPDARTTEVLKTFAIPRLPADCEDAALLQELGALLISRSTLAQRPILSVVPPASGTEKP